MTASSYSKTRKKHVVSVKHVNKKILSNNVKKAKNVTLDNLFEQMKQGEMKDLNVIIKGDVQGSVEALAASLMKIDVEGVNVRIIHTATGAINESDVTLAHASNGIIIGFNVRPDAGAKRAADAENVDMRLHRVIYNVIEEIESAMKGMLDPEFEEKSSVKQKYVKHSKYRKSVQSPVVMSLKVKSHVTQVSVLSVMVSYYLKAN